MALLFTDSFDYYDSLPLKWDAGNGAAIDLTGAHSRTGVGAMSTSGVTFPQKSIPNGSAFICGCAFIVQSLNNQGTPIAFKHGTDLQVQFRVNNAGGIDVVDNAATRASSSGGLISANVYAYLEVKVIGTGGGNGLATVRINGATVLTNVAFTFNAATTINVLTGVGATSGFLMYIDDLYLCDTTGATNNDFLGPIRVYPTLPDADSTPLQWTPSSAGAHFSLVNANPENGGATYVASQTVGQIDQYVFPLPPGVTPPVTILGAQVSLLAEIDSAGARSIGVQIEGSASAGTALTTTYHMVLQPYDTNPATGFQWQSTDFPGTTVGPVVTA